MTIRELIDEIKEIKPNMYSDQQLMRWISQLDGKIAQEVMLQAPLEVRDKYNYKYPDDLEREPMVPFPHDDIYRYWLTTQIDYTDGEYLKYNGNLTMFEFAYNEFTNWFLNTYDPAQTGG